MMVLSLIIIIIIYLTVLPCVFLICVLLFARQGIIIYARERKSRKYYTWDRMLGTDGCPPSSFLGDCTLQTPNNLGPSGSKAQEADGRNTGRPGLRTVGRSWGNGTSV
ncbi:uncharacterized protein BO95DRAFT_63808 [Aspergillus brunneoviolaceus CBS 621.78]|uniref:Uncharacterized protein n=1 Tax=Aspergillus brunneoviolaceus CBS 621.78 TaxID=1450534 RepID=A0ACD1GFP8_9EURO|nr:hypothetical protein BO95DRAFT_63808 [Aspergillus brunneoviolaceus CBS 621.78]RAH48003.1 hypothetical protein BO95DRAFT_63808 [Aspergillus brunneoviolaceus CBS 621.78]